jgi:hypothetical protein
MVRDDEEFHPLFSNIPCAVSWPPRDRSWLAQVRVSRHWGDRRKRGRCGAKLHVADKKWSGGRVKKEGIQGRDREIRNECKDGRVSIWKSSCNKKYLFNPLKPKLV